MLHIVMRYLMHYVIMKLISQCSLTNRLYLQNIFLCIKFLYECASLKPYKILASVFTDGYNFFGACNRNSSETTTVRKCCVTGIINGRLNYLLGKSEDPHLKIVQVNSLQVITLHISNYQLIFLNHLHAGIC